MSARRTARLRIEGRVQGVGYRMFVERTAVALGLDGWVRNRRDGGVEAVVSGTGDAIDEIIARCKAGPPAARVDRVEVLPEDDAVAAGFEDEAFAPAPNRGDPKPTSFYHFGVRRERDLSAWPPQALSWRASGPTHHGLIAKHLFLSARLRAGR